MDKREKKWRKKTENTKNKLSNILTRIYFRVGIYVLFSIRSMKIPSFCKAKIYFLIDAAQIRNKKHRFFIHCSRKNKSETL